MPVWFTFFAHVTVIAYAIVGGVFLAFSDFIMRALAQSGAGGLQSMQAINRTVFRWIFMALFLGLVPVSLALAGYAIWAPDGARAGMFVLVAALYVIGCFGVTAIANVPMNEALAGMDASDDAARAYWTRTYVPRWTFWNSVRSVACIAASAVLLWALALA